MRFTRARADGGSRRTLDADKIWRLHTQGVATRHIAERTGFSHSAVSHAITEQRRLREAPAAEHASPAGGMRP